VRVRFGFDDHERAVAEFAAKTRDHFGQFESTCIPDNALATTEGRTDAESGHDTSPWV